MTDTRRLVRLLNQAIAAADEPALAIALAVERAGLASHGLGLTHTHFRLNATQLHNAIRHQVGLATAPSDPSRRRSYIARINALLDEAQAEPVNLGSLIAEQASAKRMFMMIAELVKHIDGEAPIRFLIAETENAFTLLVALYFAASSASRSASRSRRCSRPRRRSIAARRCSTRRCNRRISAPTSSASAASRSSSAIPIRAATSARWRPPLRSSGCACGSPPSSPGTASPRCRWCSSTRMASSSAAAAIRRASSTACSTSRRRRAAPPSSGPEFRIKEESSFQGSDGYIHFMAPELAFATVCRIVETTLGAPPGDAGAAAAAAEATGDPIYDDADFASEFFAVVRQEFAGLVDDPDYAALLGAFLTGLGERAGSRPSERQHEYRPVSTEFAHPSQLRAIVNNTILQQLGFFANTTQGVGRAAAANAERFRAMLRQSPRFHRAMAMVETALGFSDPDATRAYVATLDPGMWLNRSGRTRRPGRAEELRRIAEALERMAIHPRLDRVYRRLQGDCLLLREAFVGAAAAGAAAPDAEDRAELALLHALRIAIIHRTYLIASHIPDFTPHQGLTREDIVQRVLLLDVERTVGLLQQIFPRSDSFDFAGFDFAEAASYARQSAQTYEEEHATLFEPLAAWGALMRRVGAAITHRIGAIG